MDSSTKKLLNGSVVYFVGSALTQFVSLLLMRFVTGNITPEEYGFFNLVTTVSNLAVPFLTLQISDAVFRFVLKSENEDEKRLYFSVCFVVAAASSVLIVIATFGISCLIVPIPHTALVAWFVACNSLQTIYQKIVRSLNRNVVLVSGNLMRTTIFLLLEIILISVLDMGVEALLLAHIISMTILLIYLESKVHPLRYFDIRSLKLSAFMEMFRFSIPLVPNSAFWWLTSSVNNVIVSAYLGIGVNGIYTVSGKFSSVLNIVTNVLNMSWQDTAVADYGKDGFSNFMTKTFNTFVKLVFSAVAVLLPFIALVVPYMIDPTYYDAIPYTPFLMLAAAISFISGFMAQIFVGKGKTTNILATSIIGMVSNVVVVAVFIGKIGLWAAVLGSLASDCVLMTTRTFLARKEFAKGIDYRGIMVVFLMLGVSTLFYFKASTLGNIGWFVVSAVMAVFLNQGFIRDIFSLLFNRLGGRKE